MRPFITQVGVVNQMTVFPLTQCYPVRLCFINKLVEDLTLD